MSFGRSSKPEPRTRPIGGDGCCRFECGEGCKHRLGAKADAGRVGDAAGGRGELGRVAVAERIGDQRQVSCAPGGGGEPPPGQRSNEDRIGRQVVNVRASSKAARKS